MLHRPLPDKLQLCWEYIGVGLLLPLALYPCDTFIAANCRDRWVKSIFSSYSLEAAELWCNLLITRIMNFDSFAFHTSCLLRMLITRKWRGDLQLPFHNCQSSPHMGSLRLPKWRCLIRQEESEHKIQPFNSRDWQSCFFYFFHFNAVTSHWRTGWSEAKPTAMQQLWMD